MIFYLGVHRPGWLERTTVPLFVSRSVLRGRRRLPRALGTWALDSGAFTEISLRGRWTISAHDYAAEVRRFADEIGSMTWAAVQDWMCEPFVLARTGLSVAEHQARTVRSYLELSDLAPELPWAPVLQGWRLSEYLDHVAQYARVGVDLTRSSIVGLGSVCRRQATGEAGLIVRALSALGIRLHGFGFKLTGLADVAGALASGDSMAWSYRARRRGRPMLPGCLHRNCANCLPWALAWREHVLRAIRRGATYQLSLDLWDARLKAELEPGPEHRL